MMPEISESIAAIKEGAKEDRFTYLTILQYHITSPEVLPTLNEVLERDVELTQEIGWDLVFMLLDIEGCETSLEIVARLGNPREVIIKVIEALDILNDASTDESAAFALGEEATTSKLASHGQRKFIILLGMLAILHGRIKTKYPSRFLGSSLVKVFEAYRPTPEMTAAVINLVRSLSGRKRPPLPSRKSSININNPEEDGDASKNAPDPEAEPEEDPTEERMKQKLLQTFVACVLQRYVNQNAMQWSPRLLEHYYPTRKIPGRKTITQSYSEDTELLQRDEVVGQLVALSRDLGLHDCSQSFVKSIYEKSTGMDPLAAFEEFSTPDDIHLSPGGAVCLIAYWSFSTKIFGGNNQKPEMHIFPDHLTLLERFLGSEPQSEIENNPGIADALLAIGLWLYGEKLFGSAQDMSFMAYHHRLTLISIFHPDIQIRNAATSFAGYVIHSDPDDQNRLETLVDLLENCMFASLKACAVTWLKEELMLAKKGGLSNRFSSPDIIDHLQYFIFPDVLSLKEMEEDRLMEYWVQNSLFLLQVVNFAYFLFSGMKELVPSGMGGAVEQRFVEPLKAGAEKLLAVEGLGNDETMELSILVDRLKSIPLR